MLLKKIHLKNFRNFGEEKFNFNPFLTIIIGENARGKTNLLEAVYLTSQSVGFRESREEELIKFAENIANIQAEYISTDSNFEFRVDFNKSDSTVRKVFSINGVKKRQYQYQEEVTKVVLFSPEQIEIMTGSPDKRRKYFNTLLSSTNYLYKKHLNNYEQALRKRNKILERFKYEQGFEDELIYWDDYLEKQAIYLVEKRQSYLDFLNKNNKIDSKSFSISYLKNVFNKKKLEEYFDLERRIKKTMIGPQKDDFQISEVDNSEKNLHRFGSRSEQRLAVFWLKFNEIKYLEQIYGYRPLLLLDDIFSELDLRNKKLVIDLVKKYQTIVTTTEIKLLELADVPKSIIKL
ncbi:hypothetical protein A2963_03270 [Candidatus Roizmanbacteria bacterium RIFCSPLOWO2_01_FULL_40_13]|nr:MAG: hypothetical protein A2963_03270 [Candidatus Roizmanbacteria bacterium RIFCSPLOWO2_01_FULL_40_13]